MAEISLYTVEFIGSNPSGEYVAGDVLDIRLDITEIAFSGSIFSPSFAGVKVYKNGVLASSGATMLDYGTTSYKIVTQITATVCSGTSRADLSQATYFPYAYYFEIANANECVINPEVCDLFIIGQPEVIDASGQFNTDGEIRINATSSNPIAYKIGSDFIYGDGTSQTSNEFLALLPGTYQIFVRDSKNCRQVVSVSVGISLDYGPKFRHVFDDIDGNTCRVDISQRDYSGAITEICGSDQNFSIELRGEGSQDKFEEILAHNSVVGIISTSNFMYQELFTNDPERYRIYFYVNDSLKSITKLLPNQFGEQYIAAPYYSNFIGHDGLPQLSEYSFVQDSGQTFFGNVKLIKLVSDILKKTKIILPIRVGINMYADDMDTTDSDDPFDQAYCDYQAFYLYEKEPTFQSVLRGVLASFGAKIIQWDGYWNIIRCEEHVSDVEYREFDSDGNYVSNGVLEPVVDLKFPKDNGELIFVNADQYMEMRPAYGTMKVVHPLGYTSNILVNGDFRLKLEYISGINLYSPKINRDRFTLVLSGYSLSESYEQIDTNNVAYVMAAGTDIYDALPEEGGNAYLLSDTYTLRMGTHNQLKVFLKAKVSRLSVQFDEIVYTIDVPYVKLRLKVQYGPFFLDETGYWTFQEQGTELRLISDEFNVFKEYEVLVKNPPKWKEYFVDLATTGNITLSGEQMIDGVMTSSSIVLVKNQTDGTDNGIYLTGAGAWTLPPVVTDLYYENAVAYVDAGTTNGNKKFIQTTRSVGITDSKVWQQYDGDINLSSSFGDGGGMPFNVKTFHAYAYHVDYIDLDDLRGERTISTRTPETIEIVPTGAKRSYYFDDTIDKVWFYELREGIDADNGETIIRPDDYNGSSNPRVWVRTNVANRGSATGTNYFPYTIDKVGVQFLTDGKEPIDTVLRIQKGEINNNRVLEKKLTLGSYQELVSTYNSYGLSIGFSLGDGVVSSSAFGFSSETMNVLPANLIYTAFLRDENGIGYELWTRDGISEADKLHGIILKCMAAQYNKPWRLMRASVKSLGGSKFGLLNVFREVNDSNRIYVPIGISLDAKNGIVTGEFLETTNIYANPGSDGSGQAPYSSGFSRGFGASAFN